MTGRDAGCPVSLTDYLSDCRAREGIPHPDKRVELTSYHRTAHEAEASNNKISVCHLEKN